MRAMTKLTFPKITGHRGARGLAPENTLPSILAAAAHGVTYFEVDAKLTGDGEVILMHDATLDRTTSGSGRVAETAFAVVRAADAGKPFPDQGRVQVPTLVELLDLLIDRNWGVNIEIKPCEGRERETAAAVCRIVEAHWPKDREPPLLSSFAVGSLEEAQKVAPHLPRGYLCESLEPGWQDIVRRLDCTTLNLNSATLSPEKLAEAKASGLPILVWTVNDPARAEELLKAGVVSIITDRPDIVKG